MIRLSERLKIIAEEIHKGETMADIGTDHGYLPLVLFKKGICPKVIMADVSRGSLKKAKENAIDALKGDIDLVDVDFRLGNGLEVLKPGEVDVVVIAGMGGLLMAEIIGADRDKSSTFKRFILQPRNGQGKLRYWLMQNGFQITAEHLAKEGRFICEILVARPLETSSEMDSREKTLEPWSEDTAIEYEVPESLLSCTEEELIIPFFKNRIKIEKAILNELAASRDPALSKTGITENRIAYLERVLAKAQAKVKEPAKEKPKLKEKMKAEEKVKLKPRI